MSACGPDVPPSRRPDDLDLSTPATRRRRVHDVESVLRCIFFKCVRAGPAATERDCREAPPDALAATWLRRQGNCVHNLSVSCLVFVRTVEGGVRAAAGKGAREGGVAAAAADGGARGTSGRGMTPASSLRRAGGSCGKEVRVFVRPACVRSRPCALKASVSRGQRAPHPPAASTTSTTSTTSTAAAPRPPLPPPGCQRPVPRAVASAVAAAASATSARSTGHPGGAAGPEGEAAAAGAGAGAGEAGGSGRREQPSPGAPSGSSGGREERVTSCDLIKDGVFFFFLHSVTRNSENEGLKILDSVYLEMT